MKENHPTMDDGGKMNKAMKVRKFTSNARKLALRMGKIALD